MGYLTNVYGHRMFFNPDDAGFNPSHLDGVSDSGNAGESGIIKRSLKAGQTALDIGANIGFYTLEMARCVGPSGSVIAFEPGPLSSSLLKANAILNGYHHVVIEQAIVLDRCGQTDLHICPTGESDNRADGFNGSYVDWRRVSVPCTTIDDYLGGRTVDFIKMDVQGAELAALRGMRRTLANKSTSMSMEFNPLVIDTAEFFALIHSVGLSIFDLDENPIAPEQLQFDVGGTGQPSHANILLRHT